MTLRAAQGVTAALVFAATFQAATPHPQERRSDLDSGAHRVEAPRPRSTTGIHADEPPAGLTRDDWSQIRRAVQESGYHAIRVVNPGEAPALQAANPRQAYRTTFRREGIEIAPQSPADTSWRLGLSVTGYGFDGAVQAVEPAEPQALKDRVEYRRGLMTEWYVNGPGGLEQGFELEQPQPVNRGHLVVTMTVQGDLDVSALGDGASFGRGLGRTVVRYAGLKALDADGCPLLSRLEARQREVRLIVEAQAARFPVTVDPIFLHEAQLFGHGEPVGQANEALGASVSISGDTVVVGAPHEDTPAGSYVGAAYVFVRSGTTWTTQQKLVASDAAGGDVFGSSVSISGDTAVVGAPGDDTPLGGNAGSAYVFVRSGTTWTQQQKLLPSAGRFEALFGGSVSISGDTVLVGAYSDDSPPGTNAGSAYVFTRSGTTWTEQQRLLASDGGPGDQFGYAVSISGDTAVVGAVSDDTPGGTNAGSAYVFVRSGAMWTEQQKLLASDGAADDGFGAAVSVSADTVIVGAPWDDTPAGASAGSAYVFVRSGTTWTEQQKILASDGTANVGFGTAVSVSFDTVIVGAPFDSTPAGAYAGSAYVFVRSGTTWTEQQKILASDGAMFDEFGIAVAVSGDTAIVGAPFADAVLGQDAGSAYVFVRSGTTWTEQWHLMGGSDQSGFGTVSILGDTLAVGAALDGPRGAAYVFVRSGATWTEQQKVRASDGAAGDRFGSAVSISGDTLLVSAPDDDMPGAAYAGSAYVFVRSGTVWTEQQKLVPTDSQPTARFGNSVSLSGDTAVIGAAADDNGHGSDAGATYVFVRSGTTWSQQQKILAPDGISQDYFGTSVSVVSDTALIGSPLSDTPGGQDTGAAYVFVRSGTTWSQQQKLVPPDAFMNDRLGYSVALSADTAVLGAPAGDNVNGFDAGAAYVFVRSGTTWTQQQKLLASDGAGSDGFGLVALSGDTAVVGAGGDDTPGPNAGSAYVFMRSGTIWTQQQKLVAPDGAPYDYFGGSTSASGDTVVVGAGGDDTPAGLNAGSVHVFREAQADLGVTKTDGQTTAVPGQPVTYTITVSNAGPTAAAGAAVIDTIPAALVGATWTCSASPGSTCTASGSGNINDMVTLAAGGTATYMLTGTVAAGATGVLTNTRRGTRSQCSQQ